MKELIKVLVSVLVICFFVFGGIKLYDYAYNSGKESVFKLGYTKDIKERLVSPKIDSIVAPPIDVDKLLRGLNQTRGSKPNAGFKLAIDTIHYRMINQSVEMYNLDTNIRKDLISEYELVRDSLYQVYYDDIQKTKTKDDSGIIKHEYYQLADDFSATLSDHACNTISTILSFVSLNPKFKLFLDNSCTTLLKVYIKPLIHKLRERGLIIDIKRSEYVLQNYMRKKILELATTSDRIQESISHTYSRTILPGYWLEYTSNAHLAITGKGVIKAGFKLHKRFRIDIDHNKQIITVGLPRATILSADINPSFTSDQNGILVKISKDERNLIQRELKQKIIRESLSRGLLKRAEKRAREIVELLYSPITQLPGSNYKVNVVFLEKIAFNRSD